MSFATEGNQTFWWEVPGILWDILGVPEKLEKKSSGSSFRTLIVRLEIKIEESDRQDFRGVVNGCIQGLVGAKGIIGTVPVLACKTQTHPNLLCG